MLEVLDKAGNIAGAIGSQTYCGTDTPSTFLHQLICCTACGPLPALQMPSVAFTAAEYGYEAALKIVVTARNGWQHYIWKNDNLNELWVVLGLLNCQL